MNNPLSSNMTSQKKQNVQVVISATGLSTPQECISNAELVASFNTYVEQYNKEHAPAINAGTLKALEPSSVEFIEKASGIKQRYVVDKQGILDPNRMYPRIAPRSNEETSLQAQMGLAAAQDALQRAGRTAQDVDAVIVACSNMQRAYPAVSVELQHHLGVTQGWAYDMNVACSSATFAIQAAAQAVQSGSANCVLVVNPEITSAHLAWQDRDCHFIFGDVATALVIERANSTVAPAPWKILDTRLKTQFSNNIRNNFGFINRCEDTAPSARDKLFMQEGRKVFKEVCPMVAEHIETQLHDMGLNAQMLRRMWLHQANLSMNQLIARRVLGRDATKEEAPVILDQYANTSSAGSIIAFHQHRDDLNKGDLGILCSFGAGYSIGSILLQAV